MTDLTRQFSHRHAAQTSIYSRNSVPQKLAIWMLERPAGFSKRCADGPSVEFVVAGSGGILDVFIDTQVHADRILLSKQTCELAVDSC